MILDGRAHFSKHFAELNFCGSRRIDENRENYVPRKFGAIRYSSIILYQCSSQRQLQRVVILRDQSIAKVLITLFQPHQRKIVHLRAGGAPLFHSLARTLLHMYSTHITPCCTTVNRSSEHVQKRPTVVKPIL